MLPWGAALSVALCPPATCHVGTNAYRNAGCNMAVLKVLKGLPPGREFTLEQPRIVLGRYPDCEIVLDVGAVSRAHAEITRVGDEFFIKDMRSRNKTYVNGQEISSDKTVRLKDNDRIKICDVLFTFHGDALAGGSSAGAAAPMMCDEMHETSTIMSTLDLKSSRSSGRGGGANAESKLAAVLEISRNLGGALGLDQVLAKILDSLFKIFLQADRAFVVLQERPGGPLIPKAYKYRRGDDDAIRISRTIVHKAMSSKEAILSLDAASDARFDTSQSVADFRIRSMMCAPLLDSEGNAVGVIQVDTLDQRTPFHQEDLDLLASVANQAAVAVENAQLHAVALARQAMERDLATAHSVQRGFLPDTPPDVPGYEFFDFYEAANQVGGDYFDYCPLPGRRLAVVVADVAGKGVAAALLMAKLSAEARVSLVSEPSPVKAIQKLNRALTGILDDRFVTLVLMVIDLDSHVVTIANAGHLPPIVRRRDGAVELAGEAMSGLPLGVVDDFPYNEFSISLAPGDTLVAYTDGITEARNAADQLYGAERLELNIAKGGADVAALGDSILADVQRFVGKQPQSDDMCLICLGRLEA